MPRSHKGVEQFGQSEAVFGNSLGDFIHADPARKEAWAALSTKKPGVTCEGINAGKLTAPTALKRCRLLRLPSSPNPFSQGERERIEPGLAARSPNARFGSGELEHQFVDAPHERGRVFQGAPFG